jgi:hypothetical protein
MIPFTITEKDIHEIQEITKLSAEAAILKKYLNSTVITDLLEEVVFFLVQKITPVATKYIFKDQEKGSGYYNSQLALDYKGFCEVRKNWRHPEKSSFLALGKQGREWGIAGKIDTLLKGLKEANADGVIKQQVKYKRLVKALETYSSLVIKKDPWRSTVKYQGDVEPLVLEYSGKGKNIHLTNDTADEIKITSISFTPETINLNENSNLNFTFSGWGNASIREVQNIVLIQQMYPQIKEGYKTLISKLNEEVAEKKKFEQQLKQTYGDIFVIKAL